MTKQDFELKFTSELEDEWNRVRDKFLNWNEFVRFAYERNKENECDI